MVILILFALLGGGTQQALAAKTPNLTAIDSIAATAIQNGEAPGLVVVVGHNGRIIFDRAYGMRSLVPTREVMTRDTIFDIASMTKVLVTAPAVMRLYEQGRLQLNDSAAKYLPEFAAHGKQAITIRQLLTHTSGLAPDLSLDAAWSGKPGGFSAGLCRNPNLPSRRPVSL